MKRFSRFTRFSLLRCPSRSFMAMAFAVTLSGITASQAKGGSIFDDDSVATKQSATHPSTAPVTPPTTALPVLPATPPIIPPAIPPVMPPGVEKPIIVKPTIPQVVVAVPRPSETARHAIPSREALDHSRGLLKEAFAEQMADRALPARHRLAEALRNAAGKAGDNQADQFALYVGAINAAKEAANLRLVNAVVDDMAAKYSVNSPQMKLKAALTMPLKADTPLNTSDNVLVGLEMLDHLIATDELPSAARLCVLLRPAAAGDPGLLAVVSGRQQKIDVMRNAYNHAAPQIEKLAASPNDAGANTAVGSYQCFYLGNWAGGLAMLAKGSDAELKKIAVEELAAPTDAESLMKLGDGWWNAAGKQSLTAQPGIRRHAAGFYTKLATVNLSPLQKIKIEKRVADSGEKGVVVTGLRDAIVRLKLARLKELADRSGGKAGAAHTPLPVGEPLAGEVTWAASKEGYAINGELLLGCMSGNHDQKFKDAKVKVTVDPGFHLDGGTLMMSNGSVNLHGEPENPIVLRNVHIGCELTGSVKASFVIFENCTFTQNGGWYAGRPIAKFEFSDCVLLQSNFQRLKAYDFGIKLDRCTFATCKFPERELPHEKEDSYKSAFHEWSHIADCEFYDCEISASVFWMPRRCNFFNCKVAETATYSSPTDLKIELGLLADDRDRTLNDLREKTTDGGSGHASFTAAPELYPAQAFPKP